MDNRKKNVLYSLVLVTAVGLVYLYRNYPAIKQRFTNDAEAMFVEGQTMGTTYHVTYFDSKGRNFKKEIDSLLILVNKSINTYDSSAEISRFNRSSKGVALTLPYFYPPLLKAQEVVSASHGAFDPTVMPLVNVWGFGPGKMIKPTQNQIDSILNFVGFEKIHFSKDSVWKSDPKTQLDFGGIGQGYGADVIADYLRSQGIENMLVELGGEGMAIGKNIKRGKAWEIGILDPNSTQENQFFKAYVALSDQSFTTSGNYFNYHVVDGVKYSHTIDPETGYPTKRKILSASVFAQDCTTADAWGTAFMVMGHEKAIEILNQHPELQAFLIYSNEKGETETYVTSGIAKRIKLENQ